MSDLRKAAQQALEALERYQVKRQDFDRFVEEIDALRAALAQPEQTRSQQMRDAGYTRRPRQLPAELAQPEPDPVASLMTNIESGDVKLVWNDEAFDLTLWRETPLYTVPPQRKPLMEEQIAEICMDCSLVTPSDIYFARAIETAHGIE